MKENQKKSFFAELFSVNGKNVKLWIMLALIPIAIVAVIFLFGNSFFGNSAYREDDVTLSNNGKEENVEINEEKPDIAIHQTGKIALDQPQSPSENVTTTKTDASENVVKDDAKNASSKADVAKKNQKMLDAKGNPVTVTLQAGQSLQTIAHDKLGNRAFWVYIYDINRDKLNNPNNLQAGMKLAIPNPDYFGFSASDKNSVQKAKSRAAEILGGKQ